MLFICLGKTKMPKAKTEQTFSFEETTLPKKNVRSGSEYQKVLDAFIESSAQTVLVSMDGKEAANMAVSLRNLITAQKIEGIKATFRAKACYLTRES
jgi:hypothetical protein